MSRVEFSPVTKRLIADRAGHQCSFPTCSRYTASAERGGTAKTLTGKAAHIFSASAGGPRGRRGLTDEEVRSPENGIWLCSDHATLIDNNAGTGYVSETLLSYKALQEARIAREHQGLYAPIGWIHKMQIDRSPVFAREQSVTLAKLNLLYGNNATGKSALCEWIAGVFQPDYLRRWARPRPPLAFRISYLNPSPIEISAEILPNGERRFAIDGQRVPFNPVGIRILRLGRPTLDERKSDVYWLANALDVSRGMIRRLATDVNVFPHAKVRNVRFVQMEGKETLCADVDGTVPGLPLSLLSGRETERVFIEFATAAARVSGRFHPTLLILDGCPTIVFEGFFKFYSHHFLDSTNQFQTIMCIPSRELDLDAVQWDGWEVIRTVGREPEVNLTQVLRNPRPVQ